MTHSPASISSLIDRWPTIGEFAEEVGCGYEAARQMRRRQRIAPQHWSNVVAACARRDFVGVTVPWLAEQWTKGGETPLGNAAALAAPVAPAVEPAP